MNATNYPIEAKTTIGPGVEKKNNAQVEKK